MPACLSPHLPWAAGHHKLWCGPQLLTAAEVPGQGGSGWLLAGRTSAASTLQPPHGGSRTRAEHGLPSTFLHPHRDLALSGAAVHGLHQSCGIGAGRGGIPSATCSATGAAHKWLISPFPAVFFAEFLCPPIILCSGFQVQNKLSRQPSYCVSSEHLTNCDEHNLPNITPIAGFALLGPSSSLWRTSPRIPSNYWLEGLPLG